MYVIANSPTNAVKIAAYWQNKRVDDHVVTASLLFDPSATAVADPLVSEMSSLDSSSPLSDSSASEPIASRTLDIPGFSKDLNVYIKDLDPAVTKEQLIAACETILGEKNCVRSVYLGMRTPTIRADHARIYFHSVLNAHRAQMLLDDGKIGQRRVIARLSESIDYDDDSCKFMLQHIHPGATIHGLWTYIEKYLGVKSVKDIRVYVKQGNC